MDMDSHFSVVGEVPGYILQANYVEALLDGRYFRAVAGWVNYVAGFLIYLAFHWVLITHHHALQVSAGWRVPLVLLQALGRSIAVIGVTIGLQYLIGRPPGDIGAGSPGPRTDPSGAPGPPAATPGAKPSNPKRLVSR